MNNESALGSIAESERVGSLDLLRGIAVLGILAMNIQAFSMILVSAFNPSAYGDLTGLNKLVWLFTYVFIEQKFYTIFTILFGAGILLMKKRALDAGRPARDLHYRRMTWLLLFGFVHAYLIWSGDILAGYAFTGMLIYWFAGKSTRLLITLAVVCMALPFALQIGVFMAMPPEQLEEFKQFWQPNQFAVELETNAYLGSWLDQMGPRITQAVQLQMQAVFFGGALRLGAPMFLGMALFQSRVLSAERSDAFYWKGLVAGFGIGFTLVIIAAFRRLAAGFVFETEFNNFINYWGAPFVAFGYICAVMLIYKNLKRGVIGRSLMAVGRMAFTNYILQSLICTFIFYGHGLGLFGQVPRTAQALVVIGVWIFLMIISPWWLKYYRYGPLEWLWRSLAYRSRPQMQRV